MKILVLDTDMLCVWLRVTKMDSCGPDSDRWDYDRINKKIKEETDNGAILVLPLAVVIETGNHISQCPGNRKGIAERFRDIVLKAVNSETTWASIADQSNLWTPEFIAELITGWPEQAEQKRSIGDVTIQSVAEAYAGQNYRVEILTGDQGLKAYEPYTPPNPFGRR